jgi:hypothetical protein
MIPGTAGFRKTRWGRGSRGKRGGVANEECNTLRALSAEIERGEG